MSVVQRILVLLFFIQVFSVHSQVDFDEGHVFQEESELEKIAYERWHYLLRNRIDSLPILAQSLSVNSSSEYLNALQFACNGCYFWRKGNSDKGIRNLTVALNLSERYEIHQLSSDISNELGNVFFVLGDQSKASQYYISSLKLGLASNDPTASFNGILGLGKSVCSNGDTILGIKLISLFLEKCIGHRKYESSADASAFLGMIFSDLGDKPVAKMYYQQSVEFARRSKSKTHIANALSNQAIVDVDNGQLDAAESNFLFALKYREELGTKKPIIDAFFNLGNFYIIKKDFSKALDYLTKAAKLAQQTKMIRDEYDALEVMLQELPISVGADERIDWERRFNKLSELIAQKKEISFEIAALSSQIVATGDAQVLNKEKFNKTLWLWIGLLAIALATSIVYYLNRPKKSIQFNR